MHAIRFRTISEVLLSSHKWRDLPTVGKGVLEGVDRNREGWTGLACYRAVLVGRYCTASRQIARDIHGGGGGGGQPVSGG